MMAQRPRGRTGTLKPLEENTGEKLQDSGAGNTFLDNTPNNTGNKSKSRQMELHWIKKILHHKENNWQGEETAHRVVICFCQPVICLIWQDREELKKFNLKMGHPVLKWTNDLNRHFWKEEIQMTIKYVKQQQNAGENAEKKASSTLLVILQTKKSSTTSGSWP